MKFDFSDILMVIGMALIVGGAYVIYPPASVIITGIVIVVMGYLLGKGE